ncbi:MAG: mechanosensitive ion channel [Deltaproteobacteria bacterium]|jgi:small-conductance mechanosensitive channel|nr:mechanosensitive ion channel [Deltaproteobacteria bacterium]
MKPALLPSAALAILTCLLAAAAPSPHARAAEPGRAPAAAQGTAAAAAEIPPDRPANDGSSPGGEAGASAAGEAAADGLPDVSELPEVPGIPTSGVPEESLQEDLTKLSQSLSELADELAVSSINFKPALTSSAETMNSLLRAYQRPGARPLQQEDILRQLRGLRGDIADLKSALDDKGNTIAQKQSELNILKAASRDSSSASKASPEDGKGQTIQQLLRDAEARSEEVSETYSAVSEPARILLDNLDAYIKRYSAEIPQTWKRYYFTESRLMTLRLPEFTGEGGYFSEWYRQLTSKETFVYPQTDEAWTAGLSAFAMSALLIAFLGFLLYRGAHMLPEEPVNWKAALLDIVKGPWIFLNLGLALLNASRNHLGGSYLFFSIPGVLILIWALASMSWKLRTAAKPSLAGQRSPLTRFYPPAAVGVLLLFADVPAGALSILWFAILVAFLVQLRKLRKHAGGGAAHKGFLLERFAYGSAVYFAVISLGIAVIGYPRLAILAFMLLFTLVNVLILGNAFAELGSILCDRIFPLESSPVKYSVLNAFLIPVTWSLSLLCTIPWLLAIPGSSSLLRNFLTTGYSIGEASFDLTKVLLILGLFFMFRSLKNLARTSLEHLPEELSLGKSVLVPIQTLLTYIVWIVFAVIVMGLLGVNWTSLAVAASGLGLGLGIGLQNIFTNVVSGLILIFGRSVQVGDYVEVGGVAGTVQAVDFRCTIIETAANSRVYVPNSSILSSQFVNWTRNGREVRRTLVIRAFYGTDTELALKLVLAAAEGDPRISLDTMPQAVLNDLNEKYLELNLFVSVKDINDSASVLSDLRLRIEQSFREHGIRLYRQSLDINLQEALQGLQNAGDGGGPAMVS